MRSNAAKTSKSATSNKSTSRSSKPKRSNSVQKSDLSRDNIQAAAELDANSLHPQSGIVESETGDRILEETRTPSGARGIDLPEPTELTAITLHQPWASLIAAGKKHYETRDWSTDYRGMIAIHAAKKLHEDESLISLLEISAAEIPLGAVVALAELTDCILMDEEFILKQSSFEQYLGLWEIGRYAWKLENVRAIEPIPATGKQGLWKWKVDLESGKYDGGESEEDSQVLGLRKRFFELLLVHRDASAISKSDELQPWNPNDFGELQHIAEADGQLNLLEWVDKEPPEPSDYSSIELFNEAYKQWVDAQTDEAEEELANFGEQELCNQLMDGSIYVPALEPDSPTPELNCGEKALISSANGTNTVNQSSDEDSPTVNDLVISKSWILGQVNSEAEELASSQQALPANPSAMTEIDSLPEMIETVSPQSLPPSINCNPSLQSSKTLPACSTAQNDQEAADFISLESLTNFPRAGTMSNGKLSAAPTLPALGVGKESLLLRSPGALSTTKGRPPGKTRLESQLHQLGLIQDGEVAAPEFLEAGYSLPVGWTNPQENRTAIKLAQVQAQQSSNAPRSELLQETETTETDEKPLEMRSTGELQALGLSELNISVTLPPNIGALSKAELIGMASEQHQLICGIERKKFKLAFEKLYRIHVTGLFLMEFKKRCQYGEFIEQLEVHGINPRVAQNYTMVSKNWETIEAKAHQSALLSENNNESPNLGINWALQVIREEKKQLKSAAPPKDPDSWRTPNTKEQPVVALVQQALGGQIWLDPCSGSVTNNIPCAVRYFKDDNGLAQHQRWSKTVFINPPFSDPFPWVERCCFEFARGNVSAAVMLLKAGTVSNIGTGELINKYASAICHWRGRINFLNDEGNAVKGSDFDCVFVYFGARLDLFRQAFQQRGTIATIDNHYSSVNKKYLTPNEKAEFGNVKAEQKQLAAAVGLRNGRSILPDMRDADRERNERYDPHTVVDVLSSSMPTASSKPVPVSENLVQSIGEVEVFDETPLAARQFEKAKCLNDYITAVSGNITEFSDEQLKFLLENINKEVDRRNNQRNDPEFQQQLRQSLLDKLHS